MRRRWLATAALKTKEAAALKTKEAAALKTKEAAALKTKEAATLKTKEAEAGEDPLRHFRAFAGMDEYVSATLVQYDNRREARDDDAGGDGE